jgi:putative acetyltransferase
VEFSSYADPYLDLMFEEYNKPKSVYYVVENNGKVVGSAGVAPLKMKQQLFVNCRKYFCRKREVWG